MFFHLDRRIGNETQNFLTNYVRQNVNMLILQTEDPACSMMTVNCKLWSIYENLAKMTKKSKHGDIYYWNWSHMATEQPHTSISCDVRCLNCNFCTHLNVIPQNHRRLLCSYKWCFNATHIHIQHTTYNIHTYIHIKDTHTHTAYIHTAYAYIK